MIGMQVMAAPIYPAKNLKMAFKTIKKTNCAAVNYWLHVLRPKDQKSRHSTGEEDVSAHTRDFKTNVVNGYISYG